ncbi:MAG: 50S ribosomal protein L25 [bacterium]|nr:50S ribosomal protein L25 [bacterium]
MTQVKLEVQPRTETSGKAKRILRDGFIPAVVYGSGADNKSIKVKKHDFAKTFAIAGEFNLIDLSIGGDKAAKVIIKDVQRDGLTNNIIHVDFYQVDMNKKITADIPLNFIGESKAVKELGGTLVKNMDKAEVSCLPGDLVSRIDVDISRLESFDQFIRLQDLVLPAGIELASATNEAVVGVVETKVEAEEVKPAEAAPAAGAEAAAEPANEAGRDKAEEAKK